MRWMSTARLLRLEDVMNRVKFSKNECRKIDCMLLVDNMGSFIDGIQLKDLELLIEVLMMNRVQMDVDKSILNCINGRYNEDRFSSLKILNNLLLMKEGSTNDEYLSLIDKFRTSTNVNEQLVLLDIFYTISQKHPKLQESYSIEIDNYQKYLKLASTNIRLKSICHRNPICDAEIVEDVLDKLKIKYTSGITGHLYNRIVVSGTNLIIFLVNNRKLYYESNDYIPRIKLLMMFTRGITHLWRMETLLFRPVHFFHRYNSVFRYENILRGYGWRVSVLNVDEFQSMDPEERLNYICKLMARYYVDIHFIRKIECG